MVAMSGTGMEKVSSPTKKKERWKRSEPKIGCSRTMRQTFGL